MLLLIKNKNKKGISVMIGYVLLVSFAIIISIIVYNWMESYVPQEDLKCEEGVSLVVKDIDCNSDRMNLTLQNSGRFSVVGFNIYARNNTEASIATIDLSEELIGCRDNKCWNTSGKIVFSLDKNNIEPETPIKADFDLKDITNIKEIEITPVKYVKIENKKSRAVCGDSMISESINC